MFFDLHVSSCWIWCFLPLFELSTEVQKCPLIQVSHLLSDLQGQNPGEVRLFCCRLCFEERCILSPFSFFKRIPHSGHWPCTSVAQVLSGSTQEPTALADLPKLVAGFLLVSESRERNEEITISQDYQEYIKRRWQHQAHRVFFLPSKW